MISLVVGTRRRGATVVRLTLAVLLVVALAATVRSVRADAEPSGSPSDTTGDAQSAADSATAMKIAATYGHAVAISSLDAEYSTTYAEPDGRWRQDLSSTPVRVQQAGSWEPVDLTLAQSAGGVIAPKASAAAVTLGSGGSNTIATLSAGSGTISYGWTSNLPAPSLDGSTATYADVLPGVDLVATVTPTGVETSVVYASKQAATSAGAITLPLTVTGLTAQMNSAGAVSYVDSSGAEVAQTPHPQAWDTRLGGTVVGPGGGPTDDVPSQITTPSGDVLSQSADTTGTTVTQATGALSDELQVPAALLNDPATTYPLVLDPGIHMGAGEGLDGYIENDGDTEINSSFDGGRVHVGTFDGGTTITRGLYQFAQGPSHGATIFLANLTVFNDYSYSCTASSMTVYKSAAFTSSVTWPGPTITTANAVSQSFAHGYNSSCASANVVYDVTGIVSDASNDSGSTNYSFELRAASETSSLGWKKFNAVAGLSIYFDRAPYAATNVGFKTAKPSTPTGCTTGSGRPSIDATQAMSWQAKLTDPDAVYNDTVRGIWKYWDLTTPSTLNWVHSGYYASGSEPYVSFAGSTTTFLDGHNYGWQVVPQDSFGVDGPYSATCEFHVSDPAPNTPTSLRFASPSLACGGTMRGDQPITLTATVSDPDGKYGKAVRGDFAVTGTSWAQDTPLEVYATSGPATSPQIPPNTLADGSTFTWTVKGDNLQKTSAAASCTGHINDAIPSAPTVTAGGVFGTNGAAGNVGDTDTITLSDPDPSYVPVAYVWKVSVAAPSMLPVPTLPGDCGTVVSGVHTVCSSQGAGWNTFSVEAPGAQFAVSAQAYNAGGTPTPIGSTTFYVNEWQPTHAWVTGNVNAADPAGEPLQAADPTGNLPLTLGSVGVSWHNDNVAYPTVWTDGATSLRFDGTGEADTGAGNPAVVDDSTHSFGVAVWLRPSVASSTTSNVAVAQDGTTVSGFWIGQLNGSWQFCMADTQSLSTGEDCASAPQGSGYVGTWTLLVAVWDAGAQQMQLYVNDTSNLTSETITHTATAAAAGAFTIGESLQGNEVPSWNGDILDPITFPGVVAPDQITQLLNCGSPPDIPTAFCA